MTTPQPPQWVAWAPPLDPPTTGGLPIDQAQQIAGEVWSTDPHLAAAMMWEAYAAQLAPTPAVSSVSTGVQSVSYSPAAPMGDYGLAVQRAEWHRSFTLDVLVSVPLRSTARHPSAFDYPWSQWWPTDAGAPPDGAPAPTPPLEWFTWTPPAPGTFTPVTFDGSGSAPGSGGDPIATYDWTFGDWGQLLDGGPSVTWTTPGPHAAISVQLTVTDSAGATGTAVQVIQT